MRSLTHCCLLSFMLSTGEGNERLWMAALLWLFHSVSVLGDAGGRSPVPVNARRLVQYSMEAMLREGRCVRRCSKERQERRRRQIPTSQGRAGGLGRRLSSQC